MDFLNLAKQGYQAYSDSQQNVSKTGGQEYNAPSHSGQDGNYQGGYSGPNIDHEDAANRAAREAPEDSGLFSSAMSFVHGNQSQHNDPIDEQHVTNAHAQAYQNGNGSNLSASAMGSAAAMQALKSFTSGGGGGGGGGGQNQLISMAMAEASKLFDSSGGAASGNKQDAVNGAAMTVMKLLVQGGGGGGGGGGSGMLGMAEGLMGGGNSGGLGPMQMMSLAKNFM